MSEVKFNKLRAKILEAGNAHQTFRVELAVKYGSGWQKSWLKSAEAKKLEKLVAKYNKLEDEFFALLDEISPRSWRVGVSASWVVEELTYADAITRGPLAVMPRISFGSSESDIRRFMRPVV